MRSRVFKAVLGKILECPVSMFESFLLRNALCSFSTCRASSRGFGCFVVWFLLLISSSCSADIGPSQISSSAKLFEYSLEVFS